MKHDLFQKEFLKGVLVKDVSKELLDEMIPIGELTSSQVMGVYQEDYRARLFEVLGENFETCWFVLGDEDFMAIANEYVESHPSKFTNLLHYGEDFPQFIAKRAPEISFINKLAQFELNFWSLFHSRDNSINFIPAQLGEDIFATPINLEDNHFLYESDIEISSLWRMRKGDIEKSFDEIQNKERIVVYKREEKNQIQVLAEGHYQLLLNLKECKTIEQAVEGIDESLLSDPSEWSTFFDLLGYIAQVK